MGKTPHSRGQWFGVIVNTELRNTQSSSKYYGSTQETKPSMSRILVIEDEKPLRSNIVDILSMGGYEVVAAPNGKMGVEIATASHPDLIISDISMPEMSGYDVLVSLRENPQTGCIPFIFLSALSDRTFVRHGMELGADDYVTKPFSHNELLAAVQARLERQTEIKDAKLSQSKLIKRQLSRVVSHELRTPLAAIIMMQDLVSEQWSQMSRDELRNSLENLQSSSYRLHHLVEQIVLMAEIEAGNMSTEALDKTGVEGQLWPLLISAINLGRRFARRNPQGMIRLNDRDRDVLVLCNAHALTHAIAEPIANALDFSPDGCDISIWTTESDAWINIVDYGPGMKAEQIEHALMDFEQINREMQEQQGLGLGLPLARKIVSSHGGMMDVQSMVGKGTQVTIRLPIEMPDA